MLVMQAQDKPKVAVVGAGWGGWAAAKALCENGCDVTRECLPVLAAPSSRRPPASPLRACPQRLPRGEDMHWQTRTTGPLAARAFI